MGGDRLQSACRRHNSDEEEVGREVTNEPHASINFKPPLATII